MNNVEKLKIWGILEDIRISVGEEPDSELGDEDINNMTTNEIVERFSVRKTECNWWYSFKQLYDYLNK